MSINVRSKLTIVAGILGIAAALGSTATVTAGTLAGGWVPCATHVAAMGPQGMPDP